MRSTHALFQSRIACPARVVFDWHLRPGAFDRLLPPWENVRVQRAPEAITPGSQVELQTRIGPLWLPWVAEHTRIQAGSMFEDIQKRGPFAYWRHEHHAKILEDHSSHLLDQIEYRLPGGVLGSTLLGPAIRRKLERMFAWRHRTTIEDLKRHATYTGDKAMKILISGSSGLVGSALVPFLTSGGHEVLRLVRRPPQNAHELSWDPVRGTSEPARLEGLDAVIHLAGENIASGRWSAARKEQIRSSRLQGTQSLARALAQTTIRPKVFLCASAIGYYGDRGEEILRETSAAGRGFLAELCQEWEQACDPARSAGIRTAHLRFGIILSAKGGALQRMLLPFRLGAGGRLASGKQWMSWIALDDVLGAILHAISTPALAGPINFVAPNPVPNAEFTRVLARVLARPAILPAPAFALRIALGEMANELLLSSQRVEPTVLLKSGFHFAHEGLEDALRHLLGRGARSPAVTH